MWNLATDNNVQVNGTGQVPVLMNFPLLVDIHMPVDVMARKGWDSYNYDWSFWTSDDPFWEVVDFWYSGTQDMEWYLPVFMAHSTVEEATMVNGSLHLRLDAADPMTNHGLSWKSAMLQSWNKFCFTGGNIEVSVTSSNVTGYVSKEIGASS
ncbi:beta-glucan synthesis-associated [Hysterangium stoloniferum]|nr:beta-glucan synthesis-associated [Hysterangium stoloniferum]